MQSDQTRAVVLAGGRGRRLEPFTSILPKPLAPVGRRPILDILLRQLRRDGFDDVVVSLGYLGELIEAYLATHEEFSGRIELVREVAPLGTAGALALVDAKGADLLVVNGDVLTDLRFSDVLRTHRREGAALTVAVQQRETRSSFGVVLSEGTKITGFVEKPTTYVDCSIGVNVYGPAAIEIARGGGTIDFPDVVQRLLDEGELVALHRHDGMWLDIGTRADFERAQAEVELIEATIIPPGGDQDQLVVDLETAD